MRNERGTCLICWRKVHPDSSCYTKAFSFFFLLPLCAISEPYSVCHPGYLLRRKSVRYDEKPPKAGSDVTGGHGSGEGEGHSCGGRRGRQATTRRGRRRRGSGKSGRARRGRLARLHPISRRDHTTRSACLTFPPLLLYPITTAITTTTTTAATIDYDRYVHVPT